MSQNFERPTNTEHKAILMYIFLGTLITYIGTYLGNDYIFIFLIFKGKKQTQ